MLLGLARGLEVPGHPYPSRFPTGTASVQGKDSFRIQRHLYLRENLFLKALIVFAIMGAISETNTKEEKLIHSTPRVGKETCIGKLWQAEKEARVTIQSGGRGASPFKHCMQEGI